MNRYTIPILLISLFYSFAMSGDGGNEPKVLKTIAELEGYKIENMWPDQNNYIDSIEYKGIKKEYLEKGRALGFKNDGLILQRYWDHRINLNNWKKLYKLGADTVTYFYKYDTMFDHAMIAHAVIIGTIEDIEFSSGPLKTTYTVNVDEVLTGNDLYVNFPECRFLSKCPTDSCLKCHSFHLLNPLKFNHSFSSLQPFYSFS